jgi:DnaJ-class molecular chaperone
MEWPSSASIRARSITLPPCCVAGVPSSFPAPKGVSLGGKAFPSYVAVTANGQMLVGEPGEVPGDLYVVVHSRPDPRFQRDGADLWWEEVLPLTDAMLGTKLEVPILEESRLEVKVAAGTQPDTVLRLGNKGLPRFCGKGKGDWYPQVKLKVPETLSREERERYKRLRELADKTKRHFWE